MWPLLYFTTWILFGNSQRERFDYTVFVVSILKPPLGMNPQTEHICQPAEDSDFLLKDTTIIHPHISCPIPFSFAI
ncbi:hypothetical protein DFP73DRAFT_537919 [Morchella snyderi]|nr:hypothetical protein DFP73DRAFT_537919 [Morchella snyderi]